MKGWNAKRESDEAVVPKSQEKITWPDEVNLGKGLCLKGSLTAEVRGRA